MVHRDPEFIDNSLMRSLLIFVVSILVLLVGLDWPDRMIFDEKFYVPAAQGIIENHQDVNYQHPPLAKQLVALSITVFGHSSWGWRFASVLMGALALVALYQLALLATSSFYALMAVILVFANGLFFTLSRLALLEIFSLGFTLLALVFWLRTLDQKSEKGWMDWVLAGVFFGLALAAKWSAVIPLVLCVIGGTFVRRSRWSQWVGFLVSVVVFYVAPFFLLTGNEMSVGDLHQAMWKFHYPEVYQSGIFENTSSWWQWALNYEPMWFAVLPNAQQEPGKFLGVMIFGNPFVIWPGWLGLVICSWAWVKNRLRLVTVTHWLPVLTLAPWLVWAVAQRPVTYYYYFLPTSVFLALALVAGIHWLVQEKILDRKKAQVFLGAWALLALTYFFYNWPLMTGAEMSAADFSQWYPHYIWR